MRCLRALQAATHEVKRKSEKGRRAEFHVFLVDDGSTDGTGEAVRQWAQGIREQGLGIRVVDGSGSLYWTRGMALAWREAVKFDFDSFLWLNDDVVLEPDSLNTLLTDYEKTKSVIVGACTWNGEVRYGINDERGHYRIPNGDPQEAADNEVLNGNVVLVPREVYEKVGPICAVYRHGAGDSDYAWMLHRAGIPFYLTSKSVGVCDVHDYRPKLEGLSFGQRVRLLFDPKGYDLHDHFHYRWRNLNAWRAIKGCVYMTYKVVKG